MCASGARRKIRPLHGQKRLLPLAKRSTCSKSSEGLERQLLISEALFAKKRSPKKQFAWNSDAQSTYSNITSEQESQDKFQLDSGERITSASK